MRLPKTRAEARSQGATQYFTGKQCKYGHIAKRQTVNGACVICALEAKKRRHKRNPEKYRPIEAAKMKKWRSSNVKRAKEANKKHNTGYVIEWRKKNKEKVRAYSSNYRARASMAEGHYEGPDIEKLYKAQRKKCAYFQFCGNSIAEGYHIDHITPLISGGSNWPGNLQLTCGLCNCRKNRRDPIEFIQELGGLV